MEQHEEDHLILDGRKVSTQETKTHGDEKESKAKNKLRMHKLLFLFSLLSQGYRHLSFLPLHSF